MKDLLAFSKKEMLEQLRSGKLLILGLLFAALGIMNPAVAKLTPWLLEMLSDSLAESGMTVTDVTVSALDSWVQFYKNIPIGLIAFVLIESSIFTAEYSTGTLVLSLTKGLARYKAVVAKSSMLFILFSASYWLCYGITYAYTAYYFDNSVAKNLAFAAFCQWLFGVFVIALMILFSTLANSSTGVILGVGSVTLVCYLAGLLPKVSRYLPAYLCSGNSLILGASDKESFTAAVLITAGAVVLSLAASVPIFNKKQL